MYFITGKQEADQNISVIRNDNHICNHWQAGDCLEFQCQEPGRNDHQHALEQRMFPCRRKQLRQAHSTLQFLAMFSERLLMHRRRSHTSRSVQ